LEIAMTQNIWRRSKPRHPRSGVVLPRPLLNRIEAAATASFEPLESFIVALIDLGLQSHRAGAVLDRAPDARMRDGGKAPAATLLRPLKASSKRTRVVRWFLHAPDASVAAAMIEFDCSREAIFSQWTAIQRDHGIGYAFDAASDTIRVRLPCDEADVFGGEQVA
jgi:hypothetical protein